MLIGLCLYIYKTYFKIFYSKNKSKKSILTLKKKKKITFEWSVSLLVIEKNKNINYNCYIVKHRQDSLLANIRVFFFPLGERTTFLLLFFSIYTII